MKAFETMTVKELREEMGKRGLPKQKDGKKFTKPELVERLTKWDKEQADIDEDIQKAIDETGQPDDNETWGETDCTKKEVESCAECEEAPEVKTNNRDKDGYIVYAKTLEEIEQKYGNRKKQEIYDNELKVGSFVVFVHYVEAKNGQIYKKLRTAKVVGINRRKELVRIVTLLGTEKELTFDELLYIKGVGRGCSYPKDITVYLKEQRTEKGKVLINEKFAEDDVTC